LTVQPGLNGVGTVAIFYDHLKHVGMVMVPVTLNSIKRFYRSPRIT